METRKPVRWGRRILLIVVLALLIVADLRNDRNAFRGRKRAIVSNAFRRPGFKNGLKIRCLYRRAVFQSKPITKVSLPFVRR